MIKRKCL